jgi:hypothetical protein
MTRSSPSSVRAVQLLRWAELTNNSSKGENGLWNSHGRPTPFFTWEKDVRYP